MNKVTSLTYAALATLVIEGDVVTLRNYLENRHVNPDETDENGQTLLMLACQNGHVAVVEELLLQGADVNAEDLDNWTALLNAAKEGHTEIVMKLLDHGATIEQRDMGSWTALMWACYKGHAQTAHLLLERGAATNVYDKNHASCLVWAAGRGHTEIVRDLLAYGAKLNYGDKYGTTPLVWACRRGYFDIVQELLHAGANVDTAGMYSWTPLIVASKGNHSSVANLLLDYKPNVNAVDMDGCTALTLACKEGFTEIAIALLNSGAYINLQDRNGDTNIIHATKAGHYAIVDALLKKYADVDIQGTDGKTALYWGVEKGYGDIVRIILNSNPNLEIATKDGDTPLMKATRSRNTEIVQMLVDKKAKVSATDRKGDTALHIAMRARSKAIVEILLRNPKNSQLLYRPNRAGETPYNIDNSHQKNILAQIFGARRLNTNEDGENMLGYDLYSSALADILSEPSLSMPISVGLYAKWGSGKSFLLNKLEDEMRGFAFQWLEPTFEFSWLVFLLVFLISVSFGIVLVAATQKYIVGLSVGSGVFALSFLFLVIVTYGSHRHDWSWAYNISVLLASQLSSLQTLLLVAFCSPPSVRRDLHTHPVRFLFTDQTKVSSSGGDMSIAQIIVSLHMAVEEQYGYMTSRLYRVFRPKPVSSHQWRWRRLCCIPNFIIALVVLACFIAGLILLLASELNENLNPELRDNENSKVIRPILIALACVVGVVFLSNLYTWVRMVVALVVSHQRRVQHNLAHIDASHTMGYLQALKSEVETMASMIQCLDAFVNQQTRMVVIVDGLDSCEQEKVLRVLDAVHLLFSDPNAPFVTVLAIDPHIIITAIESNIHRVFHNSSISGHEYLRNIVHLPFFLQNSGLRRVKAAQQAAIQGAKRTTSYWNEERECDRTSNAVPSNRKASNSSMSIPDVFRKGRKGNQKLKTSESMASSISNLHRIVTGAHDLTKVLLTDDYFSDVNPRSMRRLMNIVYITGRLLKAFNIDFNWYHLASWVNITEQWPYRTSWIILYYEMRENDLEEPTSLKSIYEKVKNYIPISREESPMLDLDHDERKFEVFLSFHSSTLQINDLKVFLPFTINLDPYIRKAIQEDHQQLAEILKTDHRLSRLPPQPPPQPPCPSLMESAATKWGQISHSQQPHPYWQGYHNWKLPGSEARKTSYKQEIYPSPVPLYPPPWWEYRPEGILSLTTAVKSIPVSLPGNQRLSTLSVEGVIQLLSSLEGIDKTRIKEYNNTLCENNITGQVLLTCDLNELKEVMKMSFGDWELFRMVILYLRDKEIQDMVLNATNANSSYCSSSSSSSENHGSMTTHRRDGVNNEIPDQKQKEVSGSSNRNTTVDAEVRPQPRSRSGSVLEKQVTMEDSMIMGALETLNEEAQEDALEERLCVVRSENMSNCGITSNPLSPILSDPEEQTLEDHPDVHRIANTIIGSFASPTEVDVLYLRSPRDSPMLHVRTLSLSDSATDVESISSSKHQIVFFPSDCPASPTLDLRNGHATPSTGSTPSIKALYRTSCLALQNGNNRPASLKYESTDIEHKNVPTDIYPRLVTTSSMEKLPKPKIRFPSDNSLTKYSSAEKVDTSSHPNIVTNACDGKVSSQVDGGESDSSENSSSESTQSTENVLLLPKVESKDANAATPQDDVDGFFSDDEHTPLVSPLHTSRPVHYYNPPVENNNVDESTSEKSTPKQSRSEGSMLYVKRRPLERQYSMENNFYDHIPQTSTSMTEIANSVVVPTTSPLYRQLSYNLAQSQLLTSFGQPVSDSTTPTDPPPFSQASSEPSNIPHIHNETVL